MSDQHPTGRDRALLERTAARLWSLDDAGRTTDVSAAMARALGATPGTMMGRPGLAFCRIEAVAAGERDGSHDVTLMRIDGRVVPGRYRMVRLEPPGEDGSAFLIESVIPEPDADALLLGRVQEAQRLAGIGTFEWDVATDTVRWDDAMCAIYGVTPGTFENSYEFFLSRLHPDDRETVAKTIAEAYAARSRFSMRERILRPDGEMRVLSSWGEFVVDDTGEPARLVGVCQDVTEREAAVAALSRSESRFRTLMASTPDAVIVVDRRGVIRDVNDQTQKLFGYEPDELVGRSIEILVPERFAELHASYRAEYMGAPRKRAMGAGLDLAGRRKDGSEFPVDVSLGVIDTDSGLNITAFVRDVTERKEAEAYARLVEGARARRRTALEINDSVVQGLAGAVYALERGQTRAALRSIDATLSSARMMMNDLLAEARGRPTLSPGDLVRARPARVAAVDRGSVTLHPPVEGAVSVLVVDDTEDIRLLLRMALGPATGFEVVGEACNGMEAIALAQRLRPDIVLLDLAMPVMDGLEALPRLREILGDVRIVVLSGFNDEQVVRRALALGADAYVEKGAATSALLRVMREQRPDARPQPDLATETVADTTEHQILAHELRTPLTVLRGLATTIRTRRHDLAPAVVDEMLGSVERNVAQLSDLVDAISDAASIGRGDIELAAVPWDIGALVAQTIADLGAIVADHAVTVESEPGLVASVDPMRIRQVVTNLVSNAAKFTPAGSSIEVGVRAAGEQIEVEIVDHGPGIDDERVPELFGRFARLGGGQGMGLGLYISRGIARAHGGDVVLRRTGPEGSAFVLRLPRVARAPASPG